MSHHNAKIGLNPNTGIGLVIVGCSCGRWTPPRSKDPEAAHVEHVAICRVLEQKIIERGDKLNHEMIDRLVSIIATACENVRDAGARAWEANEVAARWLEHEIAPLADEIKRAGGALGFIVCPFCRQGDALMPTETVPTIGVARAVAAPIALDFSCGHKATIALAHQAPRRPPMATIPLMGDLPPHWTSRLSAQPTRNFIARRLVVADAISAGLIIKAIRVENGDPILTDMPAQMFSPQAVPIDFGTITDGIFVPAMYWIHFDIENTTDETVHFQGALLGPEPETADPRCTSTAATQPHLRCQRDAGHVGMHESENGEHVW